VSALPWDTGLAPDVILAVEAAAGAATGIPLAEEEALTPPTGNITAATIEATPQPGVAGSPAQVAGANIPISPLTVPPPLLVIWAFLGAERTQESGSFAGNYNVINSIGCRGAYQFCPGTDMYKKAEAAEWTPAAQDQIAAAQMGAYFDEFGSWQAVAEAWYGGPGNVGVTGDTEDNPTILQYSIDVIDTANSLLASQGNYIPLPYPLGGGPGGIELIPPATAKTPVSPSAQLPQGVSPPPEYVESFIDGLINDIPSIPIVGSAVKSALRFVLDPVAKGIDDVLNWAIGASVAVWNDVTAGFGQIESAAETAWDDAKSFASEVGQEVLHDAESLYNDAIDALDVGIKDAEGAIGDVESVAEDFASRAVDDLRQWATDAINDFAKGFDVSLKTAGDAASQVLSDLRQWASDGFHDAAVATDAAETAAKDFATHAVDDVRQWATDGLNDVGDFAAAALKTVEDDVIAPIFGEVEHITTDILPGIQSAIGVVTKVIDWITRLASFPFDVVVELVDTVAGMSIGDFVAGVQARGSGANAANVSRAQGVWRR